MATSAADIHSSPSKINGNTYLRGTSYQGIDFRETDIHDYGDIQDPSPGFRPCVSG